MAKRWTGRCAMGLDVPWAHRPAPAAAAPTTSQRRRDPSPRHAVRGRWPTGGGLALFNSGWAEAATAGTIQRRLVGPIWMRGKLVTDVWLGDPACPPTATEADYRRARALVAGCGVVAAALTIALLAIWR